MSPAVIIFYFCILFIAFYMKRKLICCFLFPFFTFCYSGFCFGVFSLHHLHKLFSSSSSSAVSPLCLQLKKQAPFWKTEKYSCSLVLLFWNKRQLKEREKNTSKPAPFYLLRTWTAVDFNNNLWWLPCLSAISTVYIPQAWPAYTSMNI